MISSHSTFAVLVPSPEPCETPSSSGRPGGKMLFGIIVPPTRAFAGTVDDSERDIDLATGRLHARRAKGGAASVHPIGARESRALRKLQREATTESPYVFVSERGS